MAVHLVDGVKFSSLALTATLYSRIDLVNDVNLYCLSSSTSITKKWEGKLANDGASCFNYQSFDVSPTNECIFGS